MKTYTDKTRYFFIQLRARGISLGVISAELNVPKSTLGDWDKSFAEEIARLRAIEWEAVEEQFGRTLEKDLRAMAERIRKWEGRIDRMNPDHFKVREVLAVLRETRREYFRRRAILMAPLENTLTRAVTRSLYRRPDESGRYTFLPPEPFHNINDLRQPSTQPSGDGARPSPAATPDQPQPVDESQPQQPVGVPSSDGSSPAVDESRAAETNHRTPTAILSPGREEQTGSSPSSAARSQTALSSLPSLLPSLEIPSERELPKEPHLSASR